MVSRRKKLRNRDGAIDVSTYRDGGYFPDTVANLLRLQCRERRGVELWAANVAMNEMIFYTCSCT